LPQIPWRGAEPPCLARGCSACCHDIEMLLTEGDVARLRAARPGLDFFFQADDGYLQLRTRDAPPAAGAWGGPHAKPPPGGEHPRPCIFLAADGACSVHDLRPEGCRLYPAVWDADLREASLDADYCPHTDGFALPQATQDAARRLAERLEGERRGRRLRSGTSKA
jgi:uncharacterized protein